MRYCLTLVTGLFSLLIYAQQTDKVDFLKVDGQVAIHPATKQVEGTLTYAFKIKKTTDSIYLDAKNMSVSLAKTSPFQASLKATSKKIWILHTFKAGKTYALKFHYAVKPSQTMYFVGWDNPGTNQIWTQGQGKYTSYWLPSIDDMNDKIEFDLAYKVPTGLQVIANGKNITEKKKGKQTLWKFDMQHPMSSYLVAVAVGNYRKKTKISTHGTSLQFFYEPKDSLKVEPTYRYSKKIFDFLEAEIGVPYPWQNYKQVPVRDFLYAGMENTTTTLFSESFMTDSIGFIDRNYLNVNAHELTHQWFGDMVTEKSSESHWLQEGFATYYALLAEREIFGDDYFQYKLYETAEQLKKRSDNGKGEALTDPKASSLTFYQKGAWALVVLRDKIGDKAFKKGIRSYLKKYRFQNVDNADFITEMEKASGQDLSGFVTDWLKQSAFKATQALNYLKKSAFMQQFLTLSALRKIPLADKKEKLSAALDFPVNEYLGQEVVHQLAQENPQRVLALYKKAFATHNILVRQAIATSLREIPQALQNDYESLLDDRSYLTQEKALFNLWKNFPANRKKYLDHLKGVEGFSNKNVLLEWLTLNLVTQDYEPNKKQETYRRLSGYTAPQYGYEIRENAFGFLYQIDAFSNQNYKDLLQGCEHAVWRFRSFCRQLLQELLTNATHKKEILAMKNEFTAKQQAYLIKQL